MLMESLRIAILSSIRPGGTNGAAEYTTRLAFALGSMHEVEIFTPFDRISPQGTERVGEPRPPALTPDDGPLLRALKFNLRLRTETFDRFDVVWGISYNGFASRLPSRRTALITNLLGVIADEWLRNLKRFGSEEVGILAGMPPFAVAEALVARRADHVVAISRYTAARCALLYGIRSHRISTIPAFLGEAQLSQDVPGNRAKWPTVLFVGGMRSRKRLDLLLRAWRIVLAALPQAQLVIVGSGERLRRYKDLAKELLPEGSYTFLGNVERERLWDLYESAWAVCVPSEQEGFGLVSIEAQLMGTPVVVSRHGGLPETVLPDRTGFVVRRQSPRAYADSLQRLLRDESLAALMGREGRAFVKSSFTMATVKPKLKDVLHGVLGTD